MEEEIHINTNHKTLIEIKLVKVNKRNSIKLVVLMEQLTL